ncbi:hypothetical protein [Streptomyces sp. CB09001]|uniref:hypothetical protein n=1 Tax=Streptomyces sp. CB09001 TaxID=2083284 RepID=UPI001965419B|nr:hypothetical protein [Streptomyces sp. CB09001]
MPDAQPDAEPDGSAEACPDVIAEMTAVERPRTAEETARPGEARHRWAESLGEEELRALHHGRAEIFATLGEDERRRPRTGDAGRHAALRPVRRPGGAPAGPEARLCPPPWEHYCRHALVNGKPV